MAAKKQRKHELILCVTFDKPVTRGQAVKMARDLVHGTEYVSWPMTEWAEEMKIRTVKSNLKEG